MRWRAITASRRALPDFVVVGAMKAGTTSLYLYLTKHPNVRAGYLKEAHFFNLHFSEGLGRYRSNFPRIRELRREGAITGEATPGYLNHPHVPRRMHSVLPEAKLIVLLRDPVDRAYSHYRHYRRVGREDLSFEEALRREEERTRPDLDRMLRDETHPGRSFITHSYLQRGRYAEQLEAWNAYFSPEQLFLVLTEDLARDPGREYGHVLEFLQLGPHELDVYPRANVGSSSDPMDARTRAWLVDYFRPHNERLAALTGLTLPWQS